MLNGNQGVRFLTSFINIYSNQKAKESKQTTEEEIIFIMYSITQEESLELRAKIILMKGLEVIVWGHL